MEKEKEKKEERREKTFSSQVDSENTVFYPWEGGGTFLEIVSFSPDENAALNQ